MDQCIHMIPSRLDDQCPAVVPHGIARRSALIWRMRAATQWSAQVAFETHPVTRSSFFPRPPLGSMSTLWATSFSHRTRPECASSRREVTQLFQSDLPGRNTAGADVFFDSLPPHHFEDGMRVRLELAAILCKSVPKHTRIIGDESAESRALKYYPKSASKAIPPPSSGPFVK